MGSDAMAPVQVRLFGEIEVTGPRGVTTLAGNKQRAILARLALEPNRVVSVDELVDGVWGWEAPDAVRSSVQVHVSQIRRALRDVGAEGVIETRPPGYVLALPAAAVDVACFERLVADATSSGVPPEDVIDLCEAAEALWLGPPLSAVGAAPFAEPVRARLDARRMELACLRASAALAVRRPADALSAVEALALEHPFEEPLWAALVRLLHDEGRHHEALVRIATLRRTLADELGLVAGPEIAELELAILTHESPSGGGRYDVGEAVRSVAKTRLPAVTPLRGRDVLLDHVVESIVGPGLVTLIGPGGVGKTSLALHAARADSPRREYGPVFVDLAAVTPNAPIVSTVAAELGLRPSRPELLYDELVSALLDRDQLVVLDNCEHVVDHAAKLASALAGATKLTVLATSRVPLGCQHEIVVQVAPLGRVELTNLFVERARAASSSFDPDDDERAGIDALVDRLDGLPLGVELLAPLVRSMSVAEIVRQTDVFAVGVPARDATDRHRTMASAVDWSIELLSPAQRTLLTRLGVFADGALSPSVQAVCADEASGSTVAGEDVFTLLRSLVDASLVTTDRTPSGTWFRMLFPIRERAERLLREDVDEARRCDDRHARHLVELVEQASRVAAGPSPLPGVRRLEQHAPEIRRAHAWFEATADRAGQVDLLTPFGPPLEYFTAMLPEHQAWLTNLLAAVTDDGAGTDPADRVGIGPSRWLRLLLTVAWGIPLDMEVHRAIVRVALATAVEIGDVRGEVIAHAMMADIVSDDDTVAGAAHGLSSVELARRCGDPVIEGWAILVAANLAMRARRLDTAATVLSDSVSGDTSRFGVLEGNVLYQIGRMWMLQGDLIAAQSMFERTERAALAVGSAGALSWAAFGQCQVAWRERRLRDALELAERTVELDTLVAPREAWSGLFHVALIGLALGDEDAVASAVRRLGGGTSRHAALALECARGCLASCRGAREVAIEHIWRALGTCVSMNAVEFFAELVDCLAFVSDRGHEFDAVRDAVRAGELAPDAALARLAP